MAKSIGTLAGAMRRVTATAYTMVVLFGLVDRTHAADQGITCKSAAV